MAKDADRMGAIMGVTKTLASWLGLTSAESVTVLTLSKTSVSEAVKKMLERLYAIEKAIFTRGVFATFAWLAVAFALISTVFGARWAAASAALSLAVIAHMGMCLVSSAAGLANSFSIIQETYQKDLQGSEKKQAEATQPTIAKSHIN